MIIRVKPINSSTVNVNRDSEKSSFVSKWKSFASNTTLHGLRYVVLNGISFARRVVWLIFICAAGSAFTYFSSKSFEKFMLLPIQTVISQETPNDGLKFPAVTICNLNKFMKSKIDVTDQDENFEKLGLNISGCSETRAVRGNLTCGQALLCAYGNFGDIMVDDCNKTTRQNIINVLNRTSERVFNEEEFLAKYGHNMAEMLFQLCLFSFENATRCFAKDFVPITTRKGMCHTFNYGMDNSSKQQIYGGNENGLGVILSVQTNESTLSDFSSGFQVILHEQKTFVNRDIGFNIYPGTRASVAVKLRKHIRLEAPFKKNCSQVDQLLPRFVTYTKDACMYQCVTNITADLCGCRRAGFPDVGVKPLPVCSFQDQECLERAKNNVSSKEKKRECPCNNACLESEYESSVSYSKFPDSSIIKLMQEAYHANVSASYMKENYVFLQVGFQQLSYEKREELPAYGAESLFGELGGNMGLFLGCSILTICEFIDFLWEVISSKFKNGSTDTIAAESNNNYH